jgi:mannose-6-phosphate isomerase
MPQGRRLAGKTATAAALAQVRQLHGEFSSWLAQAALPRWAQEGYQAECGFQERLAAPGPLHGDARRARVQVRQVYAYAHAPQLGWRGDPEPLVRGGLTHFLQRYRRGDGLFRTRCAADGAPLDERAFLYDQAFVLLALAASQRVLGPQPWLIGEADALLAALQRLLGRAGPGFYSGLPERLPLLANPHMHLLEAALAWRDISVAPVWQELVSGITELALSHLIDARSGALLESFDEDWRRRRDESGRLIEPGHLFEWAWLLQRAGGAAAQQAAVRLIEVAEQHGVRDGVALNALLDDFSVRDPQARLWPQTERLKANARLAARRPQCWVSVAQAAATLMRYLDVLPRGLWHDRMTEAGAFVIEPSPASTLYHLVAAALELQSALAAAPAPR